MNYRVYSTSRAERAKRLRELTEAHREVGRRRREVSEIAAADPGAFALSIKFGRGVSQVNMLGGEYVADEDEVSDDESADSAAFFPRVAKGKTISSELEKVVMGAAYGNKTFSDLIIPCGACLIIGAGGSGKTPFAHALAGHGVDEYAGVLIGEPLAGYSKSEHETALEIASAMMTHTDVVVDSIKDLLASGGNPMKSGISRAVLTTISEWSALANNVGCTMYIPVNPSSDDEEVYRMLLEAARSNATSVIHHLGGNDWGFTYRTGEGLQRVENVRLTFTDEETILINGKPPISSFGRLEREAAFEIDSGDRVRGALERALKLGTTDSNNDE